MNVHVIDRPSASSLQRFENLIDGKRQAAAGGEWLPSIDPATGRAWAEVPRSTAADVDAAVVAAERAFHGRWSKVRCAERSAMLRKLADLVTENASELAHIETRDCGRILSDTLGGDLIGVAQIFYFFAGAADKLGGETVETDPDSFRVARREPVGVVAAILPWNAPLPIMAAKIGPALAAGCTIVVKPAETASCSMLRFAGLIEKAGIPAGVVNFVSGMGPVVGDALAAHPKVRKLTFTGSTDTARAITRRSAEAIKPLQFELGGKSANIVFDDAELEKALVGATTSSVFTGGAGQSCVAGSRILVQRSIYDQFVERVAGVARELRLGDPMDGATQMGPIAFHRQFEKVCSYIDIGRKEGAEMITGGRVGANVFEPSSPFSGGYWVEPVLFAGVKNDMRIAREEIFGPVACAIPFDDEDEAVAIANDSSYGLASAVWTLNIKRALRVARQIEAGSVWINSYHLTHFAMPFGGIKDSGYGRDCGVEAVRGYQYIKSISIDLR